MDDLDARNTGSKFGINPIFEKGVSIAAATKARSWLAEVRMVPPILTATHATEFEWLGSARGLAPARAIQAGTKTNVETMGWQFRVGSIESGNRRLSPSRAIPLIHITGTNFDLP
jgi:imidazolonepropionase-like amidohydrolase